MSNQKALSLILGSFNDEYLTPTVCLKLIDQAFLTFTTTDDFFEKKQREELSEQLLILQERLGNLFVHLDEE